jgi:3-phenylpropionate/trans-cinnamate dioxygenase ferredoxin subunit
MNVKVERHHAGSASGFEPGVVRRVDAGDRVVAVARIGDDFYAIGDVCSHEDVSLSEGELDAEECTLECAKHGSLFSLATGAALTLPAIKPVPVYEVERIEDDVWVVVQ